MPDGRNTKGQNGPEREPIVPWGWMHQTSRALQWERRFVS
jgi:hypothetical protein